MMILQPIATITTAAVGAATIILSAATISNVYETYALVQQHSRRLSLPDSSSLAVSKAWKSTDEALEGLSKMKRKDILELFLRYDCPAVSDVLFSDDSDHEWSYDGYLLDNGPILGPVSNFITNTLFGRGERWLGKTFLNPSSSSNGATIGVGKNRFSSRNLDAASANQNEMLDRTFEFSIGKSVLPSMSSESLFLRYAPYCPALSPMSLIWGGMVDELRTVALENGSKKAKDKEVILLGMGSFTWSGGVWNKAPFCLVAKKRTRKGMD